MILVSYAIVLASYLLILLPSDVILALTVEDGLIENIGAISFLLAPVSFSPRMPIRQGWGIIWEAFELSETRFISCLESCFWSVLVRKSVGDREPFTG